MDKEIAVAEKARRHGQHLRHLIPLQKRQARERRVADTYP
jgi:hypothetical protein